MSRRLSMLVSLVVFLVSFSALSASSLASGIVDARSIAMGGPHVAIRGDAGGLTTNPALLADFGVLTLGVATDVKGDVPSGFDFTGGWTLADVDQVDKLAGSADLRAGFSLGPISVTADTDWRFDFADAGGKVVMKSAYAVGFGHRLLNPPLSLGGLAVGLRARQTTSTARDYSWTGSTWTEGPATSSVERSLDVGAVGQVTQMLTVGVIVRDLLVAADDIQSRPKFDLGAALTPPIIGLTLAADVMGFDFASQTYESASIGIEKRLLGLVNAQAGVAVGDEFGTRFTVGAGLDLGVVSINCGVGRDTGGYTASASATLGL